MKRMIALVLALMLCGFALAETTEHVRTMGIETEILMTEFESFLTSFGISSWPLTLEEAEKADKSVTKVIVPDISLHVYQADGEVTSFEIVANLTEKSDDKTAALIACTMGALMLIDLDMSGETAIDYATRIFDGEIVTNKGLSYRYSTNPFTPVTAVKVEIADQ